MYPARSPLLLLMLLLVIAPSTALPQENWDRIPSPTERLLRHVVFVDSLWGWACGDSGAIIHTTDGGSEWIVQNSGVLSDIVNIFFLTRTHGWALTWRVGVPPFGTDILETTDGGTTWGLREYPEENVFLNAIHFKDSLRGSIGGYSRPIGETSDGGASWTPSIVVGQCGAFPPFHFLFFDPSYGFANGGHIDISGVIWRTTDGGRNWEAQCVSPEPIQKLYMFDSLNIIGVGGDFEQGSSIIRSSDGGSTWEYTFLEIFGVAGSVSFRSFEEGWATMGFERKWLMTLDSGRTWQQQITTDTTAIHDVVFITPRHGIAVGYQGVILKYNPNPVSVEPRKTGNRPTSTTLFQNYPNPFNPETIIRYSLEERSDIRLSIYDTQGRQVKELLEGEQARGVYEVRVSLPELSSGVYYYRIQVRPNSRPSVSLTQTKQMLLIK